MGFFDLLFGGGKRTLNKEGENEKPENKGFDPFGALTATGKYAKSEEQKQEEKEKKTLYSRFEKIKLKRYNKSMSPRYNDNKKRFEVGEDFQLKELSNIIRSLSRHSNILRQDIDGEFYRQDRDDMSRAIRKKRNKVQKMERQLRDGNEKRQQIYLKELF